MINESRSENNFNNITEKQKKKPNHLGIIQKLRNNTSNNEATRVVFNLLDHQLDKAGTETLARVFYLTIVPVQVPVNSNVESTMWRISDKITKIHMLH